MIKPINTYYISKKLTEAPVGDFLKSFGAGLGKSLINTLFGLDIKFDKSFDNALTDLQLERMDVNSIEGFTTDGGAIFQSNAIKFLYLIVNCKELSGTSTFIYNGMLIPSEQLRLLGVGEIPETGEMIRLDKISAGDLVAVAAGDKLTAETHEAEPTEEEVKTAQESVTEEDVSEAAPKEEVKLFKTLGNKFVQNVCNFSVQNDLKLLEASARLTKEDITKYNDLIVDGKYNDLGVTTTYIRMCEMALQVATRGDINSLCTMFRINDVVRAQLLTNIDIELRKLDKKTGKTVPTEKTEYAFLATVLIQLVAFAGANVSALNPAALKMYVLNAHDGWLKSEIKWTRNK